MGFVITKNLQNYLYILSGRKSFFHRFCDTGFKTKWTGLWSGSTKFLEYFAFKLNDRWLSPVNCSSFHSDEISATYNFFVDKLSVKEVLFIPERIPSLVCKLSVKNNSGESTRVSVDLESAVNIREMEENWHDRSYSLKFQDDKLIVNSGKGVIIIGSSRPAEFISEQHYRDHHPSELQRCFIPGIYSVTIYLEPKSKSDVYFIFSCGKELDKAISNYELTKNSIQSLLLDKKKKYEGLLKNSSIKTSIEEIDRLFKSAVTNVEKCASESEQGFGYFAGFPWFVQFWGRDSGWTIPAVVDYGDFESAKKALKTLVNFQSVEGEIPNIIHNKIAYNSVDATPLWIIALHSYVTNSGDISFLEETKDNFLRAINWCKGKSDAEGFIENEERETWMDTLDRSGKALDVQTFLIGALKCGGDLLKLLGDDIGSKTMKKEAKKLEQKFKKTFWNAKDKFYFDRITKNGPDKTKTINSIFPLVFNISKNPIDVLKRIESEEFTSKFGVRTISKKEQIFYPAGYHTGSVWGWLTALVACAEFKYNRPEKGIEYLRILFNRLNEGCLGTVGEVWNSENGNSILLKEYTYEPGACLQAWSSALIVRCVDEYMLGMDVNAFEKTIIVSPSLMDGMKVERRKRIGNDFVNFFFERTGNKMNVNYKSEKGLEYRIILSPKL